MYAEMEENKELPAVAASSDLAFCLMNYNIWSLKSDSFGGIGHLQYRDYLTLILDYIKYRI